MKFSRNLNFEFPLKSFDRVWKPLKTFLKHLSVTRKFCLKFKDFPVSIDFYLGWIFCRLGRRNTQIISKIPQNTSRSLTIARKILNLDTFKIFYWFLDEIVWENPEILQGFWNSEELVKDRRRAQKLELSNHRKKNLTYK